MCSDKRRSGNRNDFRGGSRGGASPGLGMAPAEPGFAEARRNRSASPLARRLLHAYAHAQAHGLSQPEHCVFIVSLSVVTKMISAFLDRAGGWSLSCFALQSLSMAFESLRLWLKCFPNFWLRNRPRCLSFGAPEQSRFIWRHKERHQGKRVKIH